MSPPHSFLIRLQAAIPRERTPLRTMPMLCSDAETFMTGEESDWSKGVHATRVESYQRRY